jgi:hypothetical protein
MLHHSLFLCALCSECMVWLICKMQHARPMPGSAGIYPVSTAIGYTGELMAAKAAAIMKLLGWEWPSNCISKRYFPMQVFKKKGGLIEIMPRLKSNIL